MCKSLKEKKRRKGKNKVGGGGGGVLTRWLNCKKKKKKKKKIAHFHPIAYIYNLLMLNCKIVLEAWAFFLFQYMTRPIIFSKRTVLFFHKKGGGGARFEHSLRLPCTYMFYYSVQNFILVISTHLGMSTVLPPCGRNRDSAAPVWQESTTMAPYRFRLAVSTATNGKITERR